MTTLEAVCECGYITGDRCAAESAHVLVEWMPEDLRESHEAAGNAGSWPHNGSVRLRMSIDCAATLQDDWTVIVRDLAHGKGR